MAFHAPKLLPLSLAILMAMPSTVLAAQDKHARCTGNEATGSIEPQLVDLTLAINAVNAWNRFAIAFRKLPT